MKQQKMKKHEIVRSNMHDAYYDYNDVNNYSTNNYDYVKVLDKNGISLQPRNADYKKNKYLKKDIRLSKNGSKPYVCYPDSDFNQQPDVIKVVKKYKNYEKQMQLARRSLAREANRISNDAAIEYENSVMRAKLVTEKNLLAARVNSLRLTNKAMIIEKNFNEIYTENARHKQVIKDIEKLKVLLLENNDINLKEKIAEINLNRELELDNAKSNKEKIAEKIQEQIAINKVKNEYMKERIKVLSSGRSPERMDKEMKDEIMKIKELKSFRVKDDEELEVLYLALKKMDINKISNKADRELATRIIEKFEADKKIKNLNNAYMKENENKNSNSNKVNTIRSRIFGIINKKYSAQIDNQLQKKIVLDAKKSSLSISISVEKFLATQQRSLHEYFNNYPSTSIKKSPTKSRKKRRNNTKNNKNKVDATTSQSTALVVTKQKPKKTSKKAKSHQSYLKQNDPHYVHYFDEGYTSFDLDKEFYNQKAVKDAIRKWKKIESNVESANDFMVDEYDRNSYKISYLEREKNAKKDKENFLNFLLSKTRSGKGHERENSHKEKNRVSATAKSDTIKYYSAFKLAALRRRLEKLPNDPVIFNSRNSYEYRHLMNIISEFSQLSLNKLPKTPENDNFIIEIKQIIDFYDGLVKDDRIARQNVEKSLSLDSKLKNMVVRQESKIVNNQTRNDLRYQQNVASIEQNARLALEKANKDYARRKQQIINDIDWQSENENNLHEKNTAFIKRTSSDLQKRSNIYENDQIDRMVNEVNYFNAKQKSEKNLISLDNMPCKIECFEPMLDGKIDLVQQDDGVYAISRAYSRYGSKTYSGKTLNNTIPENVSKVVVLDKFRCINNPLARASALKELAGVQYDQAVAYNLSREKSEIQKAANVLQKHKDYSDSLIDDSYEMNEYLQLVKSKSNYSTFIQNEHLKRSKTKWKITEANLKRQHAIESEELRRLEHKHKKLELAQRRIEARKDKYLSSIDNDILFENIRATNEKKYPTSKREASIVPYYSGYNEKVSKSGSFTKKFMSFFKFKKDDDNINDIIGRK